MMDPLGFVMASKAVDEHLSSARYDTPTRTPHRRRGPDMVRLKTANALHRLANAIQPHTEPSPRQHTCTPIGA